MFRPPGYQTKSAQQAYELSDFAKKIANLGARFEFYPKTDRARIYYPASLAGENWPELVRTWRAMKERWPGTDFVLTITGDEK